MIKKLPIIIFFLMAFSLAYPQRVVNISGHVTGDNKIAVKYRISGAKFNQGFNVALFVSADGGKTFKGPMTQVSGDAGKVEKGGNHQIIWNFLAEMPVTDEDLVFDVRVEVIEKPIKKSFFVSYVGNTTTYFGLRAGTIGKTGWYVEGRGNLLAMANSSYELENGFVKNYDKPGYYEFSSAKGWSAYSIIAGLTFQAGRDVFIYGGGGYGKEAYLFKIDEYSYEDDMKTGDAWVKDADYGNTGFELDTGIIIRANKIMFTAGASALNFKSFNWTAGIGVGF